MSSIRSRVAKLLVTAKHEFGSLVGSDEKEKQKILLEKHAEEFKTLLSDSRYVNFRGFLLEYKKMLEARCASFAKNYRDSDVPEICNIGGQLTLIESILSRPINVVDEYEKQKRSLK